LNAAVKWRKINRLICFQEFCMTTRFKTWVAVLGAALFVATGGLTATAQTLSSPIAAPPAGTGAGVHGVGSPFAPLEARGDDFDAVGTGLEGGEDVGAVGGGGGNAGGGAGGFGGGDLGCAEGEAGGIGDAALELGGNLGMERCGGEEQERGEDGANKGHGFSGQWLDA